MVIKIAAIPTENLRAFIPANKYLYMSQVSSCVLFAPQFINIHLICNGITLYLSED
jgi:hypothetical protein